MNHTKEEIILASQTAIGLRTLRIEDVSEDVLELHDEVERLQHHEASTVGLWATDRPDLVDDPKGVMFQITAMPKRAIPIPEGE